MTQRPSAFDRAVARVAAGADPAAEARTLVAEMTPEEKLGCLDGDVPCWPGLLEMISGAYEKRTWPAARVERLGLPGLDFADGPRGCVIGGSTCFPVSMARGASFDPELERRVGEAIGAELRAQGATLTGAVCMNLLRHPAWGRAQETYGEDPHHVGEMAAAFAKGLQRHVMACMKHFALNSIENARFAVDVSVDERALHEVYLPHFRRVAGAGVAAVMSAYNSVNGEWCGENETLLTGILRREWGWRGVVISDFVFGLRDPVKSVEAGLDVEMPFRQQRAMALEGALRSGRLAWESVDDRVAETLETCLRFARVYESKPDASVVACPAHRALAREAASASMVLLRNAGALLPVEASGLRRVAVLGELAARPNLGDLGSSRVAPPEVVTPLDGLRAALSGAEVLHAEADASIAAGADLVVVVVGATSRDEGEFLPPGLPEGAAGSFPPADHPELGLPREAKPPAPAPAAAGLGAERGGGDRRSLRLAPAHEALIRAAAAAHDRVVVAVMGGSAFVMPWLGEVPATLLIWYPGMEGGHALADVLLGRAEPGGRLPFAVPVDEGDLVPFDPEATRARYGLLHGQWHLDAGGVAAQRPFGFGLGYTRFALGAVRFAAGAVSLRVENTGEREGATVVQVYGSVPGSAHARPPWRLRGFRRVALASGGAARVEIPLDLAQLDLRLDGSWVREPAPVRLRVGFHAGDAAAELEIDPGLGRDAPPRGAG